MVDGNIAGVRRLLENVNVRNGLGETALHLAARHGLEEMAEVSEKFHARPHLAVSPPSLQKKKHVTYICTRRTADPRVREHSKRTHVFRACRSTRDVKAVTVFEAFGRALRVAAFDASPVHLRVAVTLNLPVYIFTYWST